MAQSSAGTRAAEIGRLRRAQLRRARLYLITDDQLSLDQLPGLVTRAVAGGADLVQLRRKHEDPAELTEVARLCREAAHAGNALFLVNDYLQLALEADADGVHLGQEDLPVEEARQIVGEDRIIGLSTHSRQQLERALPTSVDYVSAGPVFSTPTKPGRPAVGLDYVSHAAARSTVPVVAIGGLDPQSARTAVEAGADIVAVVRDICASKAPESAAASLRRSVDGATRWIHLAVNGQQRRCPPDGTLEELLGWLEIDPGSVVVEHNRVIRREVSFADTALSDGDELEIVHFVGGG